MTVRDLRAGDWPEVARIYDEGIRTGNATFETEVPSWEAWDTAHLPVGRLAAERAGRVVGWIALAPVSSRSCYAGVAEVSVYVAERERGTGVGSKLLATVVESAERGGIWTLQTSVFPENEAAWRCCGGSVFASSACASGSGAWAASGATRCSWNVGARPLRDSLPGTVPGTGPARSPCFLASA